MARFHEPDEYEILQYEEWLATKSKEIRKVIGRFDPWSLYRIKDTNHRVTIYSFDEQENGEISLSVLVTGEYNLVVFDRRVFGISPDDLEACDLPKEGEPVGAQLTEQEDIDNFIEEFKQSLN